MANQEPEDTSLQSWDTSCPTQSCLWYPRLWPGLVWGSEKWSSIKRARGQPSKISLSLSLSLSPSLQLGLNTGPCFAI
jgi:hypothetical protein